MSYSYSRGLSWPVLLFVVVLVFILVGLLWHPFFFSRTGRGDLTGATKNAGTLATALLEFRRQYGSYPDQETREMFLDSGGAYLPADDDANAYLSQLLVAGIIDSRKVFYTFSDGFHKSEREVTSQSYLLAAGENGFAYVMTEEGKSLTGMEASMPVILAPLSRGGHDPRFDPGVFYSGRFVYGKMDGSVTQGKIAEDGTPLPVDGVPLLQSGPGTVWGDQIPVVKMPLKK